MRMSLVIPAHPAIARPLFVLVCDSHENEARIERCDGRGKADDPKERQTTERGPADDSR